MCAVAPGNTMECAPSANFVLLSLCVLPVHIQVHAPSALHPMPPLQSQQAGVFCVADSLLRTMRILHVAWLLGAEFLWHAVRHCGPQR